MPVCLPMPTALHTAGQLLPVSRLNRFNSASLWWCQTLAEGQKLFSGWGSLSTGVTCRTTGISNPAMICQFLWLRVVRHVSFAPGTAYEQERISAL